ncbi:hypothetical protein YK48G_24800 [Lentilactobacillus fungorum]|uniref:Uncharacterized protein n=1 Tax=Lentilactobacillus fungorum TaxID=2201250 RepID=A0ABQ3W1J5_9LACO|nr:hypothetical protein YK48G_24800 [Lentilactobacillus fungorum]
MAKINRLPCIRQAFHGRRSFSTNYGWRAKLQLRGRNKSNLVRVFLYGKQVLVNWLLIKRSIIFKI